MASGIRNLFPDHEAAAGRLPGKGIQCPELLPSPSRPPAPCSAACLHRSTACCWPTRNRPSATVTFPAAASDLPPSKPRRSSAHGPNKPVWPRSSGPFFFARFRPSVALRCETPCRTVVCDELLTSGVRNVLAALGTQSHNVRPQIGPGAHKPTCGKIVLAHWNIIYQNFNNAAPAALRVSFKKARIRRKR